MPGICGLVTAPDRADVVLTLDRMVERMRHHPWYVVNRRPDVDGGAGLARVGLGFVNAAPQPAVNETGTVFAVMDGEVFDADALRAELAATGHDLHTDGHAELLLRGCEQWGAGFFARLNGSFVAALWDRARRRLLLANDRFGMKPLYFVHLPGKLLFGSEIKALLTDPEVSRALSPRGLAQFFTYGQLLGEDTLLEGVRVLPAGSVLSYDAAGDRVHLDRYWRPEYAAASSPDAEALERIDDAFQRAVDRRVVGTSQLGVSLSGGLDSRTILGVIDTDRPVTTVCLGMEGSIDHWAAERMAELTGRSHHRYVLDTEFLADFESHLRHMVHLTDGHYLCQCIVMPTLPLYRRLGIEVLLRGHAGELMHMEKAYNFSMDREALALRDEASLEAWLFRRLRTYMVDAVEKPLFTPAYQSGFDALARESLRDGLKESAGIEPLLHRIWHLFITQRLRRETAMSMVEFNSVVETRLPFLDNDLIDALFAARPELKLSETIQAHILRKRRPEFLNVVNANTGAKVGAGQLARTASQFKMKVLAKLGVKGYQPYERLGLWLRRELRPLVERLLLDDRFLGRGVFNPEAVRAVVAEHFANRKNHTYLILAMMIFEVSQQEFAEGHEYRSAGETARPLATAGVAGA